VETELAFAETKIILSQNDGQNRVASEILSLEQFGMEVPFQPVVYFPGKTAVFSAPIELWRAVALDAGLCTKPPLPHPHSTENKGSLAVRGPGGDGFLCKALANGRAAIAGEGQFMGMAGDIIRLPMPRFAGSTHTGQGYCLADRETRVCCQQDGIRPTELPRLLGLPKTPAPGTHSHCLGDGLRDAATATLPPFWPPWDPAIIRLAKNISSKKRSWASLMVL